MSDVLFFYSIDERYAAASLVFLFYGFVGWLYESFVWAKFELKHFTNRGYLLGPICPIYGFVSLLDWELLGDVESPLEVFIVSALACTCFELITSVLLERMFHKRWWDYSNYPLNFHGRISVPSSFFFGLAGLFLVKWIHPTVTGVLFLLPADYLRFVFVLSSVLFGLDICVTTISLLHASDTLERFYGSVKERAEAPFIWLTDQFTPLDEVTGKILYQAKDRGRSAIDRLRNMLLR